MKVIDYKIDRIARARQMNCKWNEMQMKWNANEWCVSFLKGDVVIAELEATSTAALLILGKRLFAAASGLARSAKLTPMCKTNL